MTSTEMGPVLSASSVPMMAAMMLPSAVPAIARRARERGGALAAPIFAGSYLGTWLLASLAICLLYRPLDSVAAGVLIVGAGLYELTPLKQTCRRRCRERNGSGVRFGVWCFGSSVGLMLVLVALDPMSLDLMLAVALIVLAQKLLPPHPALDIPLALALAALGVAIATT
jgi:predicted metal-binding membrane protein